MGGIIEIYKDKMVITKYINVKFNASIANYYRILGYEMNFGSSTDIKIEDLSKGSNQEIEAICDVCGNVKKISYKRYNIQTKGNNIFACSHKCKIEKTKKTKTLRYGSPGYSNQEKAGDTKKRRYGSSSYNNQDKIKETNRERYGVDNVYQSKSHKEKIQETREKIYGDKNYVNPNKTKETKNSKYGDKNFNNCDKMLSTKLEKYGTSTYNNREKAKITFLKNYGVDNPLKSELIFNKSIETGRKSKLHEETGLRYQGSYELDFLNNYYNKIEIKKAPKISYIFENNTKSYFPDFYIPHLNLIVEIKSKWWFEKNLEINLVKEKSTKSQGFNFIFIIDKEYGKLNEYLNK